MANSKFVSENIQEKPGTSCHTRHQRNSNTVKVMSKELRRQLEQAHWLKTAQSEYNKGNK